MPRLPHRPEPVALALLLLGSAAAGPEPAERGLLLRSLRAGEAPKVEAAVGGLDALPLLALELDLDPERRTLRGRARLDWPNRSGAALPEILYRLTANGLHEDRPPRVAWTGLTVAMPGAPPVAAAVRQTAATLWAVTLPRPLAPGERVVLEGDLDAQAALLEPGATDPARAGLGALPALSGNAPARSADGYGTFACGDDICTFLGFAPEIPAFLGGRFDDDEGTGIGDATYSEPANTILTVVAPNSLALVASGSRTGRVPAGAGRRRTTWAMAAGREVGLVASERFVTEESSVGGVVVRAHALKEEAGARARMLAAAKDSLATFEASFGRYPWAELDVAESALVGGAGGVELPGMVLVASGFCRPPEGMLAMLAGGGGAGLWSEMLDFIVRHEVAHQWWHAQVGSHPQRHPWVDEPLAQWSALHATRRAKGAAAATRARDVQIALQFQALALFGIGDGPAARPAAAFASPAEYGGLVYGKAPLFYEAARAAMGEKALVAALRGFVTAHRFRRATPADLRDALVRGAGAQGAKVDALWRRWFEEAHGAEDVGELDSAKILELVGLGDLSAMLGAGGRPGGKRGGRGAPLPGLSPEEQRMLEDLLRGGAGGQASPEALMRLMQEMMQELQNSGFGLSPDGPDDAEP